VAAYEQWFTRGLAGLLAGRHRMVFCCGTPMELAGANLECSSTPAGSIPQQEGAQERFGWFG
jgi:hypothetical protein